MTQSLYGHTILMPELKTSAHASGPQISGRPSIKCVPVLAKQIDHPHLEPHLHSATEALLRHIIKLTNLHLTGAFNATPACIEACYQRRHVSIKSTDSSSSNKHLLQPISSTILLPLSISGRLSVRRVLKSTLRRTSLRPALRSLSIPPK